jgi:hypothetical protein
MTLRGPTGLALALALAASMPISTLTAQNAADPPAAADAAEKKPAAEAAPATAPATASPQESPPPAAAPVPAPTADASVPPAAPAQWHTVAAADGSFSAELPSAPQYSTQRVATGTGSLYVIHQYLLEHGDAAFIVQTAVYPDDINVSNPRVNLQGGLDNLAKGMEGAKWVSIDWVSLQGLTAADAVGARNGHAVRSFSVMKGRQVFTLIYAGTPGTARSPDVNRFIASLRLAP